MFSKEQKRNQEDLVSVQKPIKECMQMQGHQTIAMMRQLFCFKASGPERSMTENQAEDKDPHRPVTETMLIRLTHTHSPPGA